MKRLIFDVKHSLDEVPFLMDPDHCFNKNNANGEHIRSYREYLFDEEGIVFYAFQTKPAAGYIQNEWLDEIVRTLKKDGEEWYPKDTFFILHDKDFQVGEYADGAVKYKDSFLEEILGDGGVVSLKDSPECTKYGYLHYFQHQECDAFYYAVIMQDAKNERPRQWIERWNYLNNIVLKWK